MKTYTITVTCCGEFVKQFEALGMSAWDVLKDLPNVVGNRLYCYEARVQN